jgi:hypothetical protein
MHERLKLANATLPKVVAFSAFGVTIHKSSKLEIHHSYSDVVA